MIEPYKPLFIHLNPASIPEVVAHIQKYLTEHEFVTVDDFGTQFQEYIDAHPDIIKVGSVNGLTGDIVLTSENITMTGGTSETIGTVIGDILEDASAAGDTLDDLVVDMDAVKSDIVTLENVFAGATEESSGVKGLVPAPANTQTSHYLKATGDFEAIPAREVVSAAITGASTVENALSTLNNNIDSIKERLVFAQPASVNSKVSVHSFNMVYYPALKIAYLTIEINTFTEAVSSFEKILTWPEAVPPAAYRAWVTASNLTNNQFLFTAAPTTRDVYIVSNNGAAGTRDIYMALVIITI